MSNGEDFLAHLRARETDPAWQEKQRAEREEREREYRKAMAGARRDAIAKLSLPAFHLALLDAGKLERTRAVEALERPPVLVVLSGGTGTGKTTAAAGWLYTWVLDDRAWADKGEFSPKPVFLGGSGSFITAARLARWERYNGAEMNALILASRLVIDDLGVEFLDAKGAYLSLLDEVVNERYANGRPTVMTTNMKVETFRERYGERIADRLREAGKFVALGNDSMRPQSSAGPRQPPLSLAPQAHSRPAPADPRLPREEDPDDVGTGS